MRMMSFGNIPSQSCINFAGQSEEKPKKTLPQRAGDRFKQLPPEVQAGTVITGTVGGILWLPEKISQESAHDPDIVAGSMLGLAGIALVGKYLVRKWKEGRND